MSYEEIWKPLSCRYGVSEAKAIARLVLERRFGLSFTDLVCGKAEELSDEDEKVLRQMFTRLEDGEPVQYVLGEAEFYGRLFHVEPGVLIPRPETEELCRWIVESTPMTDKQGSTTGLGAADTSFSVLDIGTGSGCIACTLAAEMPWAEVSAWDISEKALHIAKQNAKLLNVEVAFRQADILQSSIFNQIVNRKSVNRKSYFNLQSSIFNLIVSNPPYICNKERATMEPHVLDHEPEEALFVPDDDPLLFYRAIGRYALHALKPDGSLFLELNALYAHETATLLEELGFSDITIKKDQFNKERFIRACRQKER